MDTILLVLAALGLYLALQYIILPRLGVPT
jgi:hypothetical protein